MTESVGRKIEHGVPELRVVKEVKIEVGDMKRLEKLGLDFDEQGNPKSESHVGFKNVRSLPAEDWVVEKVIIRMDREPELQMRKIQIDSDGNQTSREWSCSLHNIHLRNLEVDRKDMK